MKLAKALRYILSDYQISTVQDAMQSEHIQKWRSQVIPALFDMRTVKLCDLKGNPLDEMPSVLFANYVCCVAPGKQFQFQNGVWSELYAQVQLSEDDWNQYKQNEDDSAIQQLPIDFSWREIQLPESLTTPEDVSLLQQVRGIWTEATLHYPYIFFQMLRSLHTIMTDRAYVIISDYGNAPGDGIIGLRNPSIQFYGNTLNHGVDFALFSEFAEIQGWSALLTPEPVRSIHHACLRIGHSMSPNLAESFARNYTHCFDGEDLPLFWDIAQRYMDAEEYQKAAYFAARCMQLNPQSPHYPYLAARALIAQGKDLAAQYYIQKGKQLPRHEDCNFDFQMGRVAVHLGYLNDALRYYQDAEQYGQFPSLYSNQAYILIDLERFEEAHDMLQKAFDLNPEHEASIECLQLLKEKVWERWTKNNP